MLPGAPASTSTGARPTPGRPTSGASSSHGPTPRDSKDGGGAGSSSTGAPDAEALDASDDGAAAGSGCDGSTCGIETVATGFVQAGVLSVDGTNVYVEDQGGTTGTVYQCAKTGCVTPIVLGPGYATGIGEDAHNVYWNDFAGGVVVSCAIGGCANAPTVIAPTQTYAEGLTFDGTNLYWAASGNIVTCVAPSCATRTTLATGQSHNITTLASFDEAAYWISSGSVLSCPVGGCGQSPAVITPDMLGGSIIVKNGFAYFTNSNSIVSCPVTSPCAIPLTVGSSYAPFGLGTDGVDLYWLDEEVAMVYRCPINGCIGSAEVFVDQTSIDPAGEIGANVVLDGEFAYWADAASVYRKHK